MGLRVRLVLVLGGVFVAAVALAGWLWLDVAERADARSARRQVQLIGGIVPMLDQVPLNTERLIEYGAAFGIGLVALNAEREPLGSSFSHRADYAAIGRVPPGLDTMVRMPIEGSPYRVGLVELANAAPVLTGDAPGPADAAGVTPHWLAVCVPEARARIGPVLGVAVGAGAVVCAVIWLLLLPTVRRIGRLAGDARAVSGGDLERAVSVHGPDEVGVLGEAFAGMLASLRESRARLLQAERLAALGQISTAVAHEIRNPLAAIRMTVQLMGDEAGGGGSERLREDCAMLMREAARLELFLDDLLAFARPDPGTREPVELRGVVDDVCDLEAARADHLGVALERTVAADLPAVQGDRRRLVQVCANLVLNAIQAAGPGGSVAVACAPGGPGVVCTVTDTGPGVPDDVRATLFTPFVTSKPNGTGLGLALSRRIAREHGGDLVYRRDGDRTVFEFTLPAARRPAPATEPTTA